MASHRLARNIAWLRAFVFVCRDKTMRFILTHLTRSVTILAFMAAISFAPSPSRAAVEDVLRAVGENGSAQVLVRMKANSGSVAWSPLLSVSRQRVAVATAFNDTAPALARARIAGLRHFRTIPYVATTVTREQALALAR